MNGKNMKSIPEGYVLQPDGSYAKPKIGKTLVQVFAEEEERKTVKRLRQSSKPKMNKLETEYHEALRNRLPNASIHPQGARLELANGLTYTPDIVVIHQSGTTECFEVKGGWFPDDARVKIKMAARLFIGWRFFLVWKEDGIWCEQLILP